MKGLEEEREDNRFCVRYGEWKEGFEFDYAGLAKIEVDWNVVCLHLTDLPPHPSLPFFPLHPSEKPSGEMNILLFQLGSLYCSFYFSEDVIMVSLDYMLKCHRWVWVTWLFVCLSCVCVWGCVLLDSERMKEKVRISTVLIPTHARARSHKEVMGSITLCYERRWRRRKEDKSDTSRKEGGEKY